ncbi:uncharacterized protein PGTG_16329 [Puccinia graminis f. sp. tritici CRL 75-36-700-3]|uniref:Uncharacterized protein n=1 Tax=Puccinia graminis f. sp. tritici (strain CRL 75-36-700-3 / race SCCL) TaxID=418459 RepID=E3L1A8_PUCGT|nr:uncharacterized protein PGTG_16329 [Puccinia graminis f. sp. tritici CRL 75-36-700-3]EFP90303.2 hypothetical protein PGTG_16329 [Puccinia graminis f. sp. tritici CRL 75-36-700-3]
MLIAESVGLQEAAQITPPPRANPCTPSPDDTSQGPNPSIDIWIQYRLYSDVQTVGDSEKVYKRITNRGPMPPMDLHFRDMTLSLFKTFRLKPSGLRCYTGPTWAAIYLEMPEATNKTNPWVVVTLVVHPGRARRGLVVVAGDQAEFGPDNPGQTSGGRVVVAGDQAELGPDDPGQTRVGRVVVTGDQAGLAPDKDTVSGGTKHRLEPDDLPSPKRPNLELGQVGIPCQDTTLLNIDGFLTICEIPLDYQPIRDVIAKNDIFHWTAFEGATKDDLLDLGLKWGPVQSILCGLKKAGKHCQSQD